MSGSLSGIISAIIGGVAISLWIIWSKKSGIAKHKPLTIAFNYGVFSTIWTLLFLPLMSIWDNSTQLTRLSFNFSPTIWLYLFGAAIFAGLLPHLLFYKGLQKIDASVAGIILLIEPVAAAILAWLFFQQQITISIFFGGLLILLANYIMIKWGSKITEKKKISEPKLSPEN